MHLTPFAVPSYTIIVQYRLYVGVTPDQINPVAIGILYAPVAVLLGVNDFQTIMMAYNLGH